MVFVKYLVGFVPVYADVVDPGPLGNCLRGLFEFVEKVVRVGCSLPVSHVVNVYVSAGVCERDVIDICEP